MGQKVTNTIKQLYVKTSSVVLIQGTFGDWFHTSVGVRQDCILSPTLFNIFLGRIMTEALENYHCTISIGRKAITNLRFADDIDGLAEDEEELASPVNHLNKTSDTEISAEKTKIMTNSTEPIELETVKQFIYLGVVLDNRC